MHIEKACEAFRTLLTQQLARAEAMANYVMETPTFVIGGKRVSGAVEEETLIDMIKGQI